jgi:geranylgeranyl diphosphate synthase type II
MSDLLVKAQQDFAPQFQQWLESYLQNCKRTSGYHELLLNSQAYSLTGSGKRFRPFLAYSVFKLFSQQTEKIQKYCLALEMVHTYSLIHDDLPCMDNDDFRRGKPTNHKVYKEDTALLAGDGLLSDVFGIIAADSTLTAETRIKLVQLLSEKIGSHGMVSGQVRDMQSTTDVTLDNLKQIHLQKTANLIQAAALGAAIAGGASENELHNISDFAVSLGMAFQIKDDLLDHSDNAQDFKSYVKILGLEKTKLELQNYSDQAMKSISAFNGTQGGAAKQAEQAEVLKALIEYNQQRAE